MKLLIPGARNVVHHLFFSSFFLRRTDGGMKQQQAPPTRIMDVFGPSDRTHHPLLKPAVTPYITEIEPPRQNVAGNLD